MKFGRIFLFLVIAYAAYLGIGVLLLNKKLIKKVYVCPKWGSDGLEWTVIRSGNLLENDSSLHGVDGPIIRYDGQVVKYYGLVPAKGGFRLDIGDIGRMDTLKCHIPETGDSFSFTLRDSVKQAPMHYDLPPRLLAISDIEGNFKAFKSVLQGNGVINNQFQWTYGNGHLVLDGDFFDRGLNVTECLWLIYKLEPEAEKAGGKIHFILGNHEIMNMSGQFKYVRKKYILNADTLKLDYDQWYSKSTELGRWLRSKNVVEKIGPYLFLHAGLHKELASQRLSLEHINSNVRKALAQDVPEPGKWKDDMIMGKEGPFWYRGLVNGEESQEELDHTLDFYKARCMVVGHTIVTDMKTLYHGKVVAIDLDHAKNISMGLMYALLIEGDGFYKVDIKGKRLKLE